MCIIVYKPAGTDSPSWETLHNCFKNNSDGAGFMYADNNKVCFYKGFMTWKSFKKAFKPFKNRTDLPIVIHFRIATHGSTSKGLCHPFPLTDNKKKLKKTEGVTDIGIAHNGQIALTDNAKQGMSDTADFVRKYADIIITNPQWYNNPRANKVLAELINSKMLVLSNDGHGEIIGDGWSEVDGVLFSNESYLKRTYTYYYNDIFNDRWNWYDIDENEYNESVYCDIYFNNNCEPSEECENCIEREMCWGY